MYKTSVKIFFMFLLTVI